MSAVRDKVAEILSLIRTETAEKVRRLEFSERMSPEEHRRAESNLALFDAAMRKVTRLVMSEEEE